MVIAFLLLCSLLSIALGVTVFMGSSSATMFLTGAVFFVGAAVVSEVIQVRKAITAQTSRPE